MTDDERKQTALAGSTMVGLGALSGTSLGSFLAGVATQACAGLTGIKAGAFIIALLKALGAHPALLIGVGVVIMLGAFLWPKKKK